MYIFGGWNGKDYFNDVITFDLERMVWSKLETNGTAPIPRQGHASCVVGHNLIIHNPMDGRPEYGEVCSRKDIKPKPKKKLL